eukprot:768401_1
MILQFRAKKRKLNELCDWIGPLSAVESHGQQCMFQLVLCDFCTKSMLRRKLHHHFKECPDYPVQCITCGEEAIARSHMDSHVQKDCQHAMISCSQQCGIKIKRKDQNLHIKNDCPETVIQCPFHRFGCQHKFKKQNERKHFESKSISHLVKIAEKVDELQNENHSLRSENTTLIHRMQMLESKLHLYLPSEDELNI